MKTYYILSILILILLSSCGEDEISSNDIEADKVLRYYHVICTNNKTTYVTAIFLNDAKFDTYNNPFGKRVFLTSPSVITFNGELMVMKKVFLSGTEYKLRIDNKWPDKFEWIWTDKNGKKYKDTAKMDVIDFDNNWLKSYNDKYIFEWKGSPLKKNEEIKVNINADKENNHIFTCNEEGSKNIILEGYIPNINPFKYQKIKLTRTFNIRKGDNDVFDELQEGSYIRLIYIVEK